MLPNLGNWTDCLWELGIFSADLSGSSALEVS
jgi:hypothetical protein